MLGDEWSGVVRREGRWNVGCQEGGGADEKAWRFTQGGLILPASEFRESDGRVAV